MITIGITGGVGAGKSSILSYLKAHYNCTVLLADNLASELKQKGEVCYAPIVSLLGDGILDLMGNIDNKKMAALIFDNEELLGKVNAIIHPEVKKEIVRRIEEAGRSLKTDYFFLEAALLIEEHYDEILDEIWYVYASERVRRKRLKKSRGYSDSKIDNIMASQLSEEEFRRATSFTIRNGGPRFIARMDIRRKMKEYGKS